MRNSFLIILSLLFMGCSTMISRSELATEFYNIGNAYFDMGDTKKAQEYYLKAVAMDNSLVDANYNLARAYIESKMYDKGLEILGRLYRKDQQNTLILNTMAYAYYLQGDEEQSIIHYEKVLEIFDKDFYALYNLGLIYLDRKEQDIEKALSYLTPLLEIERKPEVLKQLAYCNNYTDKNDEAITLFEEYLLTNNSDIAVLEDLKEIYIEQEVFYKAIEKIDSLLNLVEEEERLPYLFEKGRIFILYMEEYEKGVDMVKIALKEGFSDKKDAESLIAETEGGMKDTLQKLFKEFGVYP